MTHVDALWPARVLVVARWYPSHDAPWRGSFIADRVRALRAAGVEVVVASWDIVGIAPVGNSAALATAAAAAWSGPVGGDRALTTGSAWGVSEVPVARLPIVTPGGDVAPADDVAAHAALLVPFGRALWSRWPFDLIDAHVGVPDGAASAVLAEELALPLLVTEHGSHVAAQLEDPRSRGLYTALRGPGRAVSAVSRPLASTIEGALAWEAGSIPVVPNPVPIDDFPLAAPAERDPDELLWVGARRESKGMAMLLEAFAIARATAPSLRLRMIGAAPDAATEARWRTLAADLGLGDAVTFEGSADRAGVAAAMRRAGLFVHPSPRETFGMVAAEALATGLPIVARRSGGVEAILEGTGAGSELADPDTSEGLAAAVLRLRGRLADVDGMALRASISRRYAPGSVALEVIDLAAAVAASGGATVGGRNGASLEVPAGGGPVSGDASRPSSVRLDDVIVIGLRRAWAARRVGSMPAELAASLTVITGVNTDTRPVALPTAGRWLELDPDRRYREGLDRLGGPASAQRSLGQRLSTAVLHPGRAQARRALLADRSDLRDRTLADDLSRALGSPEAWSGRCIVALDAEDVAAAAPLLAAGATLAPGSLRWLADGWSAGIIVRSE